MARIAGINLPPNKRVEIGLTYLFGIGKSLTKHILKITKVNPDKRVRDLTTEEVEKIKNIIEKECKVGGDLRREIFTNIRRLREIGCYRGIRHTKKLPVRGQRTRTNSRTVRGNIRKTMGSGRRPAAKKV